MYNHGVQYNEQSGGVVMDIGSIIKQYRHANKISMRDFAEKCGVSHSYIAMLEIRKTSKTGEPIVPTIAMLKKIASGLGITVNELIAKCDDMPITLSDEYDMKNPPQEPKLREGEEILLSLFRRLPKESQALYIEALRAALKTQGLE